MSWLTTLFMQSIYNPALAARMLLDLNLDARTGWMALALASILNSIVFSVTNLMFPPPAEFAAIYMLSPVMLSVLLFVLFGSGAVLLYGAGRMLDGKARFQDILAFITWLQFLRAAVQFGGLIFMLFLPGLATLLMFAASLYGIWILLNFINVGQEFQSLAKSAGSFALTFVGLTFVLFILVSISGLTVVG